MSDETAPPNSGSGGEPRRGASATLTFSRLRAEPPRDLGPSIKAVKDLVEEHFEPKLVELTDPITGTEALGYVDRDGVHAVPASVFDDYLDMPRRRKGTAVLLSLDSLIAHAIRFKGESSIIFADDDRTKPSLTTVLDYHAAGADSQPSFGQHRSAFAFPLSDEWKAWAETDKKPMPMAEFSAFLEDRINDVLYFVPDEDELPEDLKKFINISGGVSSIATPERLVELSRGLRINEASAVREVINLQSGEGQILFQSEHSDEHGLPLRVPSLFLIAIPVFRNDGLYRIAARLRYRKTPGGIVFWYELWRADRVFDHAFRMACDRVRTETDLPLLFGKPEA